MLSLLWQLPAALLLLGIAGWTAMALWYRGPARVSQRAALIVLWLLLAMAAIIGLFVGQHGWIASAGFAGAYVVFMLWWIRLQPKQQRNWAADVERLLVSRVEGDLVHVENVRNFVWRTREDFDARWETRDYDLSTLCRTDLVVSYWMGPAIAHTLVSFGFEDGRQLVFSVEVRRLVGQNFSPYGGFFKQSELVIVAADERDIVRTRSNVRAEDVYIYNVAVPLDEARALFKAYLAEASQLHDTPRFYHTLFSNCTTIVYDMIRRIVPGVPWDHRLLMSGYLPDYVYDLGALDTRVPFAELQALGHINKRALEWDRAQESADQTSVAFSRAIRTGVPAATAPEHARADG